MESSQRTEVTEARTDVPGGRFRLSLPELKNLGEWKWMDNPFVDTIPYYGLLVILLMFNSSDLKDSNNSLYEYRPAEGNPPQRWFVVRDIGTALGSTARLAPVRGDPDVFERLGFINASNTASSRSTTTAAVNPSSTVVFGRRMSAGRHSFSPNSETNSGTTRFAPTDTRRPFVSALSTSCSRRFATASRCSSR
jgi:hypothetical protein